MAIFNSYVWHNQRVLSITRGEVGPFPHLQPRTEAGRHEPETLGQRRVGAAGQQHLRMESWEKRGVKIWAPEGNTDFRWF